MTKKHNDHQNGYDFDQTIEFTKDDLKNLRKPNQQPKDGDYFSQQLNEALSASVNEEQQSEHLLQSEVADDVKVDQSEKLTEDKNDTGKNPFIYHSQTETLRAIKQAEKVEAEKIAREKRQQFKQKFESKYDQIYDEDQIDSFENYNQFDVSMEEDEASETIVEKNVNNSVSQYSLKILFNQLKETILSKLPQKSTISEIEEKDEGIQSLVFPNDEKDINEDIIETSESEVNQLVDQEDLGDEDLLVMKSDSSEDLELTTKTSAHDDTDEETDEDKNIDTDVLNLEDEMQEIVEDPILTDHHLDEVLVNEDLEMHDIGEEELSFVKGTAWLTAGNIISRILGALYVIPWGTWFGTSFTTANVLYSIGYNPYALFLAISTGGFPSAIAKQMAFYHSKKEYKTADRIFKYSLVFMLFSGVITAGLLFVLAPFIANISSTDNPQAATIVIRSLSPALLILPIMSLLRGYFQGFGDMMPTAISQILEQIARVVYMLAATYGIMKLWSGDVTTAVAHSTFAAFIGALLSLIYLVYLYVRRLSAINLLKESSVEETTIDFKESLIIVLKDSIPFILLGSGIIITKFIDQISFKFILESTSTILLSDISELFGVMNLDVDKLIMIIISIAVGMSLSSIPLITSLYAKNEKDKVANLIEKIIVLFLVVMLPAALGLASIANNMYEFFYPFGHQQGPSLLVTASYLSIVLGAYTILSTIIQSMDYRRIAIKYLTIGLLAKIVLQFPLVAWLHAHGAIIATMLAFLITSVLMLIKIHRLVTINFKEMVPDFIIILSAAVLMAISANFWNGTFDLLFGPVGRLMTFVKILLVVLISGFNYLGILALFGKLNLLIGSRYQEIQEKVRLF